MTLPQYPEVNIMAYDQPFYRRSAESVIDRYSTRVLLGTLCSVAGIVLLLQIPISSPTARIGWSTRPVDRIMLSDIQREKEPPDTKEAPPPTQHSPPQPDGTSGNRNDGNDASSPAAATNKKDTEDPVRTIAALSTTDEVPEIMGGMSAFYLHIQYPPAARRKGIEGRLELRFTVGTEGDVRRIQVAKSLHPLCDSAAVRALRSVKFAPGTHEGAPVPVRMSLPVRFTLRSSPVLIKKTDMPNSSS